jgi:hypothetical protein
LWSLGDFENLLQIAWKFLLQTLTLLKFSFKSARWLTAVWILIMVHLHCTWRG